MKDLMKALDRISKLPDIDAAEWLSSAESSIEFLKQKVESDRVVLYASMPCVLIHSVLAPLKHLNPPNEKELSQERSEGALGHELTENILHHNATSFLNANVRRDR